MLDWDRLAIVLVGAGVALHAGYSGWRAWRQGHGTAAAGLFLIATAVALLPVMLVMWGR